jgi:hypothetical protein
VFTKTDLRQQPVTQIGEALRLRSGATAPAAMPAYSQIELPGATRRSDFDAGTVAIVASIVMFKLLMLSVLFVAF